ncbi:MAG: tetratricopeptide repeat protein [Candidatus Aminicenantes bacterium]|nr:tetratricopeptide repeat protein [Candidatus Aminicenantes bacterium]
MALSAEEKELKKITTGFDKAIQAFHKKEFQKTFDLLNQIIDGYKDSEYESVLEIQTQSKAYRVLADLQLTPQKKSLKTDEDYINEGIYYLNVGNLNQALKLFNDLLEKKKYKDPYVFYLMASVYVKQDDQTNALKYLKKCVSKDDSYKIIAYNEPDFDSVSENEEFLSLVE